MTDLPPEYADLHRFKFGDSRALCEELTQLALDGKKTGTCWPHRMVGEGEPMLKVGDRAIYTDWDGTPVCAVAFTKIELYPFDQVPEAFALSEGEGTYDAWRRGHIAWLERIGGWAPDTMMVCENFRVIERFDRPNG